MSAYNFKAKECSPTKLWHLTRLEFGVLTQVQFWKHRSPLLKFGRAKKCKI